MISNNISTQPQHKELIKKEEIIKPKKEDQNVTDDFARLKNHNLCRTFHGDIGATSVINQVNKHENTNEELFSENLTKLKHHSVSTNKGIIQQAQKRRASESSAAEVFPENAKKQKAPAIIEGGDLHQADGLMPKDIQWMSFLKDFFRQRPISASSLNRITSLQAKAGEVKEIIFLVEHETYNRGYGNLNLFIEFLRNFVRLSPGTLNLIRFSGCKETLSNKLPNLLSGLPGRDIDDLITQGEVRDGLSTPGTRLDKIFGIPYTIQRRNPNESFSDVLQIYTFWDSFKVSPEAPLFQIINYRWFPMCAREDLVQNQENHLPIYPYEVCENTSTTELMKREIANSLQTMNPEIRGSDTEKLALFFTELLQLAKENEIYLALSYHASGMSKARYYNYTNAAKACFSDKPIVIIAPHNEKKYLSEKDRKKLSGVGKVQFSTNYSLHFMTEKSCKDKVTVFEFDFLPKRLFELVCYFSNIPIYAPGASTANIAQCLNKPYLGFEGHEMTTTGSPELLGRWMVANDAFRFDSFRMQKVKKALLTMSKEQIKLSVRINWKVWMDPENAHLKLDKICNGITDHILTYHGLIATLIPHFFNGTDTSKIHKYPILSDNDRQSYFTRLLNEGRLPEFCQYVCDKSNEIMLDYMSRTTTPGDSFYELAGELQKKALHPDNNMMLEVLERNLPNN